MGQLWAAIVIAICLVPSFSFAQSYEDGATAALTEQNQTVNDIVQMDLSNRTQITLNTMISEANQALKNQGFAKEAEEFQKEWDAAYSGYFLTFQMMDLGDHQPLNAWLADYYKKLVHYLGMPLMKLLHLDDINTMNYAIPVVFQPNGDRRNGDHWNQVEYSKHFVPFSEIVVYWSSYIGCRIATRTVVKFKKYCGIAASTLKTLTGSLIAPKLSNYVFHKMTNAQNAEFVVDYDSFNSSANQKLAQIPKN